MATTQPEARDRPSRGAGTLFLGAAVSAAAAHGIVGLAGASSPAGRLASGGLLRGADRAAAVSATVTLALAIGACLLGACLVARRRGVRAGDIVRSVAPLGLLGLAPYVLDAAAWRSSPLLLLAVASAAVLMTAWVAQLPRPVGAWWRRSAPVVEQLAPWLLVTAIGGWIGFVAAHTVCNHWSLGTSAYDLGIHENVVWNTLHGRFFESAIEAEGNHLGVHTSLVLLLVLPVYAVAQRPETLLVVQAVVLGAAAWPLYLLALKTLGSRVPAALAAAVYLLHPGVHGAAFYDFHAVAFAPLLLFSAAWALATDRRWLAAAMVLLLLSVKEDMSFLVLLLGAVALAGGRRRTGALLAAAGALAYLVLQGIVIPHFAAGAHSYTWYYADLIPAGEGPAGLVRTVIAEPLSVLRYVLTPDRILYLLQMLVPFAFVLLLGMEGWVLPSYGLAASLLASRSALHQLGFQYALVIVAPAAVAFVLVLGRLEPGRRRRALAAAVALAVISSWAFGMVGPRVGFRGGFRVVDFDYDATDRARHQEIRELAAMIPSDASVTASEALVPHVARRRQLETIRYAPGRPGRGYEYFFILHGSEQGELARMPEVQRLTAYEVVEHGRWCSLLRRRPD